MTATNSLGKNRENTRVRMRVRRTQFPDYHAANSKTEGLGANFKICKIILFISIYLYVFVITIIYVVFLFVLYNE